MLTNPYAKITKPYPFIDRYFGNFSNMETKLFKGVPGILMSD